MRTLSLPLNLRGERAERVRGIPLLRLAGASGLRYAALPAGSNIDLKAGRLEVNLQGAEEEALVVFDRVDPAHDEPYDLLVLQPGPAGRRGRLRDGPGPLPGRRLAILEPGGRRHSG